MGKRHRRLDGESAGADIDAAGFYLHAVYLKDYGHFQSHAEIALLRGAERAQVRLGAVSCLLFFVLGQFPPQGTAGNTQLLGRLRLVASATRQGLEDHLFFHFVQVSLKSGRAGSLRHATNRGGKIAGTNFPGSWLGMHGRFENHVL